MRATVAELKNAIRMFSFLSASSKTHSHGFDEKKIETHVAYCKHLLEAAMVHAEAAEREEKQNLQRLEAVRQMELAEESRRKAEEQRKLQVIIFVLSLLCKSFTYPFAHLCIENSWRNENKKMN